MTTTGDPLNLALRRLALDLADTLDDGVDAHDLKRAAIRAAEPAGLPGALAEDVFLAAHALLAGVDRGTEALAEEWGPAGVRLACQAVRAVVQPGPADQ